MAKAAAGHETEKWEDSNQLVAEYLRYDHGQDLGANIADLLLSWYQARQDPGLRARRPHQACRR